MLKPCLVASIVAVDLIVLGMGVVFAQDYPRKPIRIVASGAGTGTDFEARLIAQGVSGPLGQPVIVDNRGGGFIAPEIVSKAPPDGYTVLINGGNLWIGPLLQKAPFDPIRDFSPIAMTEKSASVLVVHPSVAAKSVKEFIAYAKSKPGGLNYASTLGGFSHLAAELFKAMTAVDMVRVSYKGNGAAATGVVGGESQLIFGGAATVGPFVKSGKLRALAVTSVKPSALFPDLPTVAATVPGYEAVGVSGIFAPAKTPLTIIRRLNQEIVRFLATAETKERYLSVGSEAVGSSPEEFTATLKADMARWGKVIKDADIRIE